jgi:ectoine hydroxylase-related dioxygenase (phytanoyl-CoA dioxygenase family)
MTRRGFDEDGFILGERFLPTETLRRIADIGERVHAEWLREQAQEARKDDPINSQGLTATRYFRPPFHAQRALFFDALAGDALYEILTGVFGDDLYFHGTQMFFNPLRGERRSYWHRDLQYMNCDESRQRTLLRELCNLHVRIPLRAERSFMLVPGSHARWDTTLERNVRLERSGHGSWEDLPSAHAFDLSPGDVLIFSAHMLHRGTYEGNSERLSLDLMLGKADPCVPTQPDLDQLPTRDELVTLRHPGWYERAHELFLAR